MPGPSSPALAESPEKGRVRAVVQPHAAALVPGMVAVALMLVWAVHNGGYDADTWYWGALLLLGVLAVVLSSGIGRLPFTGASGLALAGLAGYVLWSYASIAWAGSPGDALEGSNRALLYLLMFALMVSLPWTSQGLLAALVTFALGVGVIAFVILFRLASTDHVAALVVDGRLEPPTGYFNSTAALFTIDALLSIGLASRRELPGLLRGVLLAVACAGLQLAVIGQSRGWLFTLPVVAIAAIAVVRDRLRVAAAAVLPIVGTLIPVHRLLAVFGTGDIAELDRAARRAGHIALLLCGATLVVGTLIAWGESLVRPRPLSARGRRALGTAAVVIALGAGVAGTLAATSGHPFSFIKRQWLGFTHPTSSAPTSASAGSYFGTVGTGRYDFWRVSLDAALAHPIGGLGQDNFTDYYITRRHTDEEPKWTHSLEMRLLAMNGFVGFGLFALFLVAALVAALRRRTRAGPLAAAVAGIALLPLVVWVVHGSVDWFWEMPALSGPALGFLGAAIALARSRDASGDRASAGDTPRRALPRWAVSAVGALALIAAVVVLAFPYLSVREVSTASDLRTRNPKAALDRLATAARLNPLSPQPGLLAGTIALQSGDLIEAEKRFRQSIDREPGAWFSWFGAGLAASALGDSTRAKLYFERANAINSRNDAVRTALARVQSDHPLTPAAALKMLVLAT
jgi:Tfp pilus assembly protein PilF